MTHARLALLAALALAGCASTPSNQAATSWGKGGVSLVQYWTDSSECALAGATASAQSGGNLEGVGSASDFSRTGNATSNSTGGTNLHPVGTAGSELNTNMYDVASRAQYNAALQQRAADQARSQVVTQCLTQRGYRRYQLTAEQSAHLAGLAEGSPERRAYLHQLGSDPAVLSAQGL